MQKIAAENNLPETQSHSGELRVTTHCALIPYWLKRLGKRTLRARQISQRGGELFCEDRGKRVGIGGNAVTYLARHLCV